MAKRRKRLISTVESQTAAYYTATKGLNKFTKGYTGAILCDCARKKQNIAQKRFETKSTKFIKCKCSIVKSNRSRGIRSKAEVVVINESTDFGFKNSNLA